MSEKLTIPELIDGLEALSICCETNFQSMVCDQAVTALGEIRAMQLVSNNQNQFAYGVVCMSRNVLPALELVRDGRWTIDTLEQWLHAVIQNES
jgi:hypothetical protein